MCGECGKDVSVTVTRAADGKSVCVDCWSKPVKAVQEAAPTLNRFASGVSRGGEQDVQGVERRPLREKASGKASAITRRKDVTFTPERGKR